MNKVKISPSSSFLPDLARIWRRLTRNWLMKMLCLIMAFVVWQSVRENTSFEVVISDVPVIIHVEKEGRAVLEQSVERVNIRFRGSRDEVRFISNDRIQVQIDLSGRLDRSRQIIKLTQRHVKTPSRAHAVQFDPPEIVVMVDREVERILPVKAVFEGTLPQNIRLEKVVCTPAAVTVRGAERLLSEIDLVQTLPIRYEGRTSSFQTYIALDAAATPWVVAPDHVTVDALLTERVETRRIENSEVRPMLTSDDTRVVKIRPESVAVTLRGNPKQIAELNERDIYSYIDCTELTDPADYEVSVRVDFPAGLQIEKIEPAAVQVTVKKM